MLSLYKVTREPRQWSSQTTAAISIGRISRRVIEGCSSATMAAGHSAAHQRPPHTAPMPRRELSVLRVAPASQGGAGGRMGKVPFHRGANSAHHTISARTERVTLTRWYCCDTEWAASSSRRRKPLPGGTQRQACTNFPIRDSSSLLVTLRRTNNTCRQRVMSPIFRAGSSYDIVPVSTTIPSISTRVDGGVHFSGANGTTMRSQTSSRHWYVETCPVKGISTPKKIIQVI